MTHRAQGNRSSGKTDETTVTCMRLVYGIGIFVAELVDNLSYFLLILVGNGVAN